MSDLSPSPLPHGIDREMFRDWVRDAIDDFQFPERVEESLKEYSALLDALAAAYGERAGSYLRESFGDPMRAPLPIWFCKHAGLSLQPLAAEAQGPQGPAADDDDDDGDQRDDLSMTSEHEPLRDDDDVSPADLTALHVEIASLRRELAFARGGEGNPPLVTLGQGTELAARASADMIEALSGHNEMLRTQLTTALARVAELEQAARDLRDKFFAVQGARDALLEVLRMGKAA